jgi:hypothetical protein
MITEFEFQRAQDILDGKSWSRASKHEFAFTGMIQCAQCTGMITAEEKTKTLSDGSSKTYVYYRCSKRKGPCSQKPIRLENLEEQIQAVLNDISIPKAFVEWAMDCIREENAKESDARVSVMQNHRKQYDIVIRKIDGLIDMRAGSEITEEEFSVRKASLMAEKERFNSLLGQDDNRVDEWLMHVEDAFTFAEMAGREFQNYSLVNKKQVLATLGSNFVFNDGKLSITKRKLFEPIEQAAREVRAIHKRLEPTQTPIKQRDFSQMYDRSPVLGG